MPSAVAVPVPVMSTVAVLPAAGGNPPMVIVKVVVSAASSLMFAVAVMSNVTASSRSSIMVVASAVPIVAVVVYGYKISRETAASSDAISSATVETRNTSRSIAEYFATPVPDETIDENMMANLDRLVAMLESFGHTVDTSGMAGAMNENQIVETFDDPVKVAKMNSADLIIMSRRTNSGAYDDNTMKHAWNELETPLLLMSAYQTRGETSSKKWGWSKGGSGNASPTTETDMAIETGAEGHAFLELLSDVLSK